MLFNIKNFLICLLPLFLLSCGKVTQELPKEAEVHSFELSFSLDNISKQNSNASTITNFSINNPIFAVIKGFNSNESDQLAYGKLFITEVKEEASFEKQILNKEKLKRSYDSKAFDIKGKEIQKKPIHSQVKGSFNSSSSSVTFKSPNVSSNFDMYLIAIYSDKSVYKMTFLDHEDVSKNKTINLDFITDFDTFQSTLRLAAFHNIDYSNQTEALIKTLFDFDYFSTFPMPLPKNKIEKFSFSKPLFALDSSHLSSILTLLEHIQTSKEITLNYLQDKDNADFSAKEKSYLSQKINRLSSELFPSNSN